MREVLMVGAVWAVLLGSTVIAYRRVRQREAADARVRALIAERCAAFDAEQRRMQQLDRAMSDDRGACWICTAPVGVLELVDAGDRYELACAGCAETLKLRRVLRQERAA